MKVNNEAISEGRILRLKREEKNFYIVNAEKFRITDEIFSHVPTNYNEEILNHRLKEAARMGCRNFWVPRIIPSYDANAKALVFKEGLPAAGLSTNQWNTLANEYYVERYSRVANKYERALIIAHIIKALVKEGVTMERAWEAVTRIHLGNMEYHNSKYEEEVKIISQYEDLSKLKITFTGDMPELWSSMSKTVDVGYHFSYCDEAVALVVLTAPPEEPEENI